MSKCSQSGKNLERGNLDLADCDGHLKNMNRDELSRKKFSHDFLKPREAYVLVEIKPTTESSSNSNLAAGKSSSSSPYVTYQARPLLTNSDIVTSSFLHKLNKNLNKNASNMRLSHRNSISSLSNTSISSLANGNSGGGGGGSHGVGGGLNEKTTNSLNSTSHKPRKSHK